jgi:anthranilate phosphoribosyltransferase
VPETQIGSFLLGLSTKGETVDEILGATLSMRSHALTISAPPDAIDIVGTGGDGHDTLNISTAVAFVVAACGVPVAKHGNRGATSRSGSSDLLMALGVNIDADVPVLEECLAKTGLCFLFAPKHHPSMRHVANVRKKLGVRTIFNLLGPLTNPANVKRHMIGCYALDWLGPMAEVLKLLGSEAAWLAHGHDGMDEITTTTDSDIVELRLGGIRHFTLSPAMVKMKRASLVDLKGGDSVYNAAALIKLFQGETSAYRDIVLLNSAAALIVGQKVADLQQGVAMAGRALDNGVAARTLQQVIDVTHRKI